MNAILFIENKNKKNVEIGRLHRQLRKTNRLHLFTIQEKIVHRFGKLHRNILSTVCLK